MLTSLYLPLLFSNKISKNTDKLNVSAIISKQDESTKYIFAYAKIADRNTLASGIKAAAESYTFPLRGSSSSFRTY